MWVDIENYPYLIPMIWQFDVNQSPNVMERIDLYGVFGFPDSYWGGNHSFLGFGPGCMQFYIEKYNLVAAVESPAEITATFTTNQQDEYIIQAEITEIGTISTENNKVIFILTDDFSPEQEPDYFCSVVSYHEQDYTSSQSYYEQVVTFNPEWDITKIKAIILLQTLSSDFKIHQAAITDYQEVGIENNQIPTINFQLTNYPNPFNPNTTISFNIEQTPSFVTIDVFNLKGQKVRNLIKDILSAGQHSVGWNGIDDNGKPISSGIYFYKIKSGNQSSTKKMILMK